MFAVISRMKPIWPSIQKPNIMCWCEKNVTFFVY